jgi:hypothetical protein
LAGEGVNTNDETHDGNESDGGMKITSDKNTSNRLEPSILSKRKARRMARAQAYKAERQVGRPRTGEQLAGLELNNQETSEQINLVTQRVVDHLNAGTKAIKELDNIRRGEKNQVMIETQRMYLELERMYDFHLYRLVSSSSSSPFVPIIYFQALVVGKTERRNEFGFLIGQRTFQRHAGT